jgi:hypothetical protein
LVAKHLYTRVSITQLKAVHQRTYPAHRTGEARQAAEQLLPL